MIKFEDFKLILDEAKRYMELSDSVYESTNSGLDLANIYGIESGKYTPECFLVCMLEKLCEDSSGVIGWWAFEMNWGELIAEEDLENYPIKTLEDLYNYITKENN